jgi:AraC family ethanolamine operon transcriptional activator
MMPFRWKVEAANLCPTQFLRTTTPQSGGVTIFFHTQKSSGWGNGRRIDESSLMIAGAGDEFCLTNDAPGRWCSLYIPNGMLTDANGDATTAVASMHGVVHMSPHRFERFRLVLEQLGVAARRSPGAFESAAAQRAAERKLIGEIRNLLAVPHEAEPTHGRRVVPRREIIRMSMDFVDQQDREYLAVEQLAAVAGVSERTLRAAFHQYFGATPVQYLKLRTLHHVRKALKGADPSVATVTEIATQFGVWHFGRFARDYRFLFGELPSETVRHL